MSKENDSLRKLMSASKALAGPIGRVDAIVVPFSHGGRDSNGIVTKEAEAAATILRLLNALDEASAAIGKVKASLSP